MQNDFIIAAAQFAPINGNVSSNIQIHQRLITQAIKNQVNVIIFPELSLTGYEHDVAQKLAFTDNDPRLEALRILADQYNITIIAGAPINIGKDQPQIGLFVLSPHQATFHYSKIYLHPGEDKYYTPGTAICTFDCQGNQLGLAICADTNNEKHADDTINQGASFYLSSVLITANGYDADTKKLQNYAKNHQVPVIMANYCGVSGSFLGTGRSAIWDNHGILMAEASETQESLIIANFNPTNTYAKVISSKI
ncbi:TPA: carbon-nitrogen hydrolase family protein [Providencia rettgeri]